MTERTGRLQVEGGGRGKKSHARPHVGTPTHSVHPSRLFRSLLLRNLYSLCPRPLARSDGGLMTDVSTLMNRFHVALVWK